MKTEIKVPEVGEAVKEALLVEWYRKSGDLVKKDEILFLIETDKVTLEVTAQADGRLEVLVASGETVPVGSVVGTIEAVDHSELAERKAPAKAPDQMKGGEGKAKRDQAGVEAAQPARPQEEIRTRAPAEVSARTASTRAEETEALSVGLAPSVRKLVDEHRLDVSRIVGTGPGGSITKGDVLLVLEGASETKPSGPGEAAHPAPSPEAQRARPSAREPISGDQPSAEQAERVTRKAMSRIRRRIAERLLDARRNTAMLTTFNEIDMSRVQEIRAAYKEGFKKEHGVGLGMMSFFIKASIEALKAYPEVNAFIEENDLVYHHYYHVGVAIGAERGLVVPVIRDADRLSFAEIEQAIVDYVKKIQENRLEISDLEDGTFTISNGGVYGSLLSTPILNTPQSGILGMHKVEDRPVVVNGSIVVRPMMYVALSYDHRIIDGREAVGFLKHIKECVEHPERILIGI